MMCVICLEWHKSGVFDHPSWIAEGKCVCWKCHLIRTKGEEE